MGSFLQALRVLGIGILISFSQAFLLLIAGIMWALGTFFIGGLVRIFRGNTTLENANELGLVGSTVLVIAVLALIWLLFWWLNCQDGQINHFVWKVVFASLPLVCSLCIYRPATQQDLHQPSMALFDVPDQFGFSCLVTALVLFPLYSIGLYRFLFRENKQNVHRRNTFILIGGLLFFGSLLFYGSWQAMPHVYHVTPLHL